ncbi:MAG: oxygen-dependent coproporphyrinogen oxidase [Cyclobacteriaceae bacterium]
MNPKREEITEWFRQLQDSICEKLEKIDGKARFLEDRWDREEGGGGRSRVITKGNVIEKGGVNFSAVHGQTPAKILEALQLDKADFYATGVSIVLHPYNPMVPIIHMNVRYFEMSNGTWWFGGGIDVTPHYVFAEDARYFHHLLKEACDAHDLSYYEQFKKWADDYFYIKHRDETRGIGGIFFDRLSEVKAGHTKQSRWDFVKQIGESFIPAYAELVDRHKDDPYTEDHKAWQSLRRGRYVEFNLVWDKGTKFGLDTKGRTESILMSMPPMAQWEYNHVPADGTEEAKTLSLLKKDIDWIND